jgi:DEAD/DEAH box helicase domain-containing protein
MNASGIFSAARQGSLFNGEVQLLVRESINGVIEQRGGNENVYPYPLPRELGFFMDQPFFNRNYFTTGVVISDPVLSAPGIYPPALAELLYDVFLLLVPFDQQDIGWAADSFREEHLPTIQAEQPFLAIFDQVYGSLRLSARLLEPGLLGCVLLEACLIAGQQELAAINPPGRQALKQLCRTAFSERVQHMAFGVKELPTPEGAERVILPDSKGLLLRSSEEFRVVRIIHLPGSICYEGIPASMAGTAATVMPQLADVAEIPGESHVGLYYPESGVLEVIEDGAAELAPIAEEAPFQPAVDAHRLASILTVHLDIAQLRRLGSEFSLDLARVDERGDAAQALVSACVEKGGVSALVGRVLEIAG